MLLSVYPCPAVVRIRAQRDGVRVVVMRIDISVISISITGLESVSISARESVTPTAFVVIGCRTTKCG